MELYQVKIAMVNFTYLQFKRLINFSTHRENFDKQDMVLMQILKFEIKRNCFIVICGPKIIEE